MVFFLNSKLENLFLIWFFIHMYMVQYVIDDQNALIQLPDFVLLHIMPKEDTNVL